jgi:hypothetical protein
MFDLDQELRRWRQETELTLAFEPDEIDELEDHLKLAMERAVAQGASPEEAWKSASARLGDSPPLAAEFAKSKLMPALFHLLRSWWQVGLLFVIFGIQVASTFNMNWPSTPNQGEPRFSFWILTWISFATLVALMPGRTARNALLIGVGNAFCLIPLLYAATYNSFIEHFIGFGWSRMGAPMGWWPPTLAILGLVVINLWARRRCPLEDVHETLAVAAAIILLLALAPFVGELTGNLSLRELYHMPTAQDIPYAGAVKTQYMQWKFVDVLINSCVMVATWVPLILAIIGSGGIIVLQRITRRYRADNPEPAPIFPSSRDLPWFCGWGGGATAWFYTTAIEPNFLKQIREADASVHHAANAFFGVPMMTVMSAILFLLCAHELTRRLGLASRVRPFYAIAMVVMEAALLVSLGLVLLATLTFPPDSGAPDLRSGTLWRTAGLSVALVVIMLRQIWSIAGRARRGEVEPSVWRFQGRDLVRVGSLLGLISACAGLFLIQVALELAFVSVQMISALINWGNSIEHPNQPFNPESYFNDATQTHYPTPHLDFWIFSGLSYVSFCLVYGYVITIALSGIEFIRFNAYRYYKVRKAERARRSVLAVNE